ncbi:MAG: dockerin type I repeat-containing protein [Clostridia bacterium]|nr:dockerin type I repeat-containing protein [Clostridia bacterium]
MNKLRKTVIMISTVLLFLIFCGFTENYADGEYYRICDTNDVRIRVFAQYGENSYLVNSSKLYKFSINEDDEIETEELSLGMGGGITAGINSSCTELRTFSSFAGKIQVETYSLATLSKTGSYLIDDPYGDLTFICSDDFGNVFYVERYSPKKLCVYSSGRKIEHDFNTAISSVCVGEKLIYVCAEGKLFAFTADSFGLNTVCEREIGFVPTVYVSPGLFIDTTGDLRSIEQDTPKFSTGSVPDVESSPGKSRIDFCTDGKGGFYGVSASYTAIHYSNEPDLRYTADSNIFAVGPVGLITYKEGGLHYSPYDSFEYRSTSGGSGEPGETMPQNWNNVGDYLIFNGETALTSLTSETSGNFYLDGEKKTSGYCRTGMRFKLGDKEYKVVVTGDVNGSGTINSADFTLMEDYLVGNVNLADEFLLAGDMNDSGFVGTEDLVIFRNIYLEG